MLPAKYQPNWHSGSGEKVFSMVFTIQGYGGHPAFRIIIILAKFCITVILMLNMKFHKNWLIFS